MKLIVGAPFQGKRDFLDTLLGPAPAVVADGNACGLEDLRTAAAVEHFQLLVRRMAEEQLSVTEEIDRMLYHNPNIVVLMELPVYTGEESSRERCWQKAAGAAGRYLASQAEEVYQVTCGIPVKLA